MRTDRGQGPDWARDPATFALQVRDALAHLYDPPALASHPLVALLPDPRAADAGRLLHQLLLRAVEQSRPPESLPPDAPPWRRYRALRLRYVECVPPGQAASALAISERQTRRECHEAIESLAAILWARYRGASAAAPAQGDTDDATTMADALDLAETVDGVRETLRPLLAECDAAMAVALPPALPRARVARVALRQALLSVVVESLDLGRRSVFLHATQVSDRLRLVVRLRGSATSGELRSSPGVARELLRPSGGELLVRSAPDGEDVEVLLPMSEATVLLVDDDPGFVRLVRRCLAGTSYTLHAAWQVEQALAQARAAPPAVIMLDVLMPSLDGWDLLHKLKADPRTRETPVLVCSVLREESLARALGAAGYLSKPVTPRTLIPALERCRTAGPQGADRATPARTG